MPIIPPGSVYSPGDEIASTMQGLGPTLSAIFNPRRAPRERAKEMLQNPEMIERMAKGIYAESVEYDPATGEVGVNQEKMNQAIDDNMIAIGLDPTRSRESALFRPIVEGAIAATSTDFQIQADTNAIKEFHKVATQARVAEKKAAIAESEATIAEGGAREAEAGFNQELAFRLRASGIPQAQAEFTAAQLSSDTHALGILQQFQDAGILGELSVNDPVLAAILESQDMDRAMDYLAQRELDWQRALIASQSGVPTGMTANEERQMIETRHAIIIEAQRAIVEAKGNASDISMAVDNYNRMVGDLRQFAEARGMPLGPVPVPVKGLKSTKFGFAEEVTVQWRYSTPFEPRGIPQYKSFIETVRAWGQNPAVAPEDLDKNVEAALKQSLAYEIENTLSRSDRTRMITDLENNAGHTLPKTKAYLLGVKEKGVFAKARELAGVR